MGTNLELYLPWQRPDHRNLIVIGAGAAGLVTSYIAATVRARVTLVEADQMGRLPQHRLCLSARPGLRTARLAARLRHGDRYGLPPQHLQLHLPEVLERGTGQGGRRLTTASSATRPWGWTCAWAMPAW